MKKAYFSSPEMVYQGEVAECGLACATMLLNTLGEKVTLSEIRDEWGGGSGSSLDLLVNILASYGHAALPVKFDLVGISYLPTPCILHYGGDHYVYVYSQHGNLFQLLNPSTGRYMISADELAKSATGYALLLDESLYNKKTSSGKLQAYSDLLDKLSFPGLWRRCLLAISLSLFGLITPVLFASISKDQNFFEGENVKLFFPAMISLFFIVSLMQYLSSKSSLDAALTAAKKYQPSLFSRLLKKDISYFERRDLGDIKQRVNSIGTAILNREKLINDKYRSLSITIITLAIMFWLDYILSVLSIATMSLFGVLSYYFSGVKKTFSKRLEESTSQLESFNIEAIKGIHTIRSGLLSTFILNQYNKLLDILFCRYRDLCVTDARQNLIFSFLKNIDMILFLWISFYSINNYYITYSTVIAFWFFRQIAMDSINQFYQCTVTLKLQKVSSERINDMLTYKEVGFTQKHIDIKHSICIRNLQFGYGSESTIFDNLTVDITQGSVTAVIGESGAGKSTLLKIMAGLYSPRNGSFIIDGKEIMHENRNMFYSNMYYLPQEAIVFSATIYENMVLYSGGEANEHTCREILKKFGLLDVIMSLPAGIYTKISSGNPVLSSGQLQRLMLCRALLSPKDIILLDEPTANLDDFNAMLTINALLSTDKTIVLSTHDTKMLHLFENIIDLDKN